MKTNLVLILGGCPNIKVIVKLNIENFEKICGCFSISLSSYEVFKIPDVEGAGNDGQLAIDMSPVQPHTVQKNARDCEECLATAKAMGYGIGGGLIFSDPSQDFQVDLMTADRQVLPAKTTTQKPGIGNLTMDWSRFVTEEGKQVQTVGHHFSLSGSAKHCSKG